MQRQGDSLKAATQLSDQILEILEKVGTILSSKGIRCSVSTPSSLEYFSKLNTSRQREITEQWSNYYLIISQIVTSQFEEGSEMEKAMILKAAEIYGYNVNPNNLHFIRTGEVIELYNLQMIQLYRNLEFFRHCSYDLLTLSCYEWPALYERATQVTNSMISRATEFISLNKDIPVPYNLPIHTMRERHLNAKRVFEIRMGTCLPIIDSHSKSTIAFITTAGSKLIAEGDEANKLSHL